MREAARPDIAAYRAVGSPTRTRVVRRGREVLGADAIRAAFPGAPLAGGLDIAHVASAPDGTIVVAVHGLDVGARPASALEIWRHGRLVSAFRVPSHLRGGVGFAERGTLIAVVDGDGEVARLFTREGRPAGSVVVTTW